MFQETHPRQLVDVVTAKSGTIGAQILDRIQIWAPLKQCKLICLLDRVQGLYLTEMQDDYSFSLRYDFIGDVFHLRIGARLPARFHDHVAQSIVAMIKRGRNWRTRGGAVITEAYGLAPKPRRPFNPNWREEWRQRRRSQPTWAYEC